MFKKSIAMVILTAFCITQAGFAAPIYKERPQNLRQDTDTIAQASGVKADLLGASRAAAMDWQEFKIPEESNPWNVLGTYGLRETDTEYIVLRPPDSGKPALQPFEHDGAYAAIPTAVSQTLGAVLFKGKGKGFKVIADGSAVFMGFHSLIDYTLRHPDEALVILGDEGDRDASIALRVGSIFFREEVIKFTGIPALRAQLKKLLELRDEQAPNGVKIRGVIGDGLENTNSFVEGGLDTWSVTAIVDLPQDIRSLRRLKLIPDKPLRIAGWVYNAPQPAEDLSPFDLPKVGFRKIAVPNGINPDDDPKAFEQWMSKLKQVTLHGNRPSLGPNREDGDKLRGLHPGFATFYPDDGDLFPSNLAAMGVPVDGHKFVSNTRSGGNEGTIARIAANNCKDAHFTHTYISAQSTNEATSLTEETGHNFPADDIATSEGFGITREDLRRIDTEQTWPYKGLIAMSTPTGTSKELAGQWMEFLKPVEFQQDKEGRGGKIIVHTFFLARDGSAYVVRTTFHTDDLQETKEWLKLASRLPSPIPLPTEKPESEIRTLKDLRGVVAETNQTAIDTQPNQEAYRTFRFTLAGQLAELTQNAGVGFHLTFLHPGQIGSGMHAEHYGTKGHFHLQPVGELVEIYDGEGEIILWQMSAIEHGAASNAIRLSVKTGDKFFVPPEWAHKTLNSDPKQILVFGTWLKAGVGLNHESILELHGAPWFIGPKGSNVNSHYTHVPDLGMMAPNSTYMNEGLGIPTDRPVWSLALTDPDRFLEIMNHVALENNPDLTEEKLFTSADAIGLQGALAEKEGFSEFSEYFRNSLEAVSGEPEALARYFQKEIEQEAQKGRQSKDSIRQKVLEKLRYLAQDPGAPFNQPPESWYLIANFLYLRLQDKTLIEMTSEQELGKALRSRLDYISKRMDGKDLTMPENLQAIIDGLKKEFSTADEQLRSRLRFSYNSLYFRNGTLYLSADVMTGAEENLADGVKSSLLVSIPNRTPIEPPYDVPYLLAEIGLSNRKAYIHLFDPLDFIKRNFKGRSLDAGLVAERDIYEAWQTEYEAGRLHTMLRVSDRVLNAAESGRGFFIAVVKGNTVLLYHLVHTESERFYTNMTAITAPANLILSLFKEGMLGKVIWSFEADHNRPTDDSAEQKDYVGRVLDEIARSGVHSGVTIDTVALINDVGKTPSEKYDKALDYAEWQLEHLDAALKAQEKNEPGSVFFQLDRWYIEIDLAPDKKLVSEEDTRYIGLRVKKLGERFGCAVNIVPGIGFEHGISAGAPQLDHLEIVSRIIRKALNDENVGMPSHAGSGWPRAHLIRAKEIGSFCINNSTVFGNILLAVLRDFEEDSSERGLYERIWDRLFDEFKDKQKGGRPVIPDNVRETVEAARKESKDYQRPYDLSYDKEEGAWLVTNERSKWLADVQREWVGLRDEYGRLVFHNDLVWGISENAWNEYARLVEITFSNNHRPEVMNGDNMRPVVEDYLTHVTREPATARADGRDSVAVDLAAAVGQLKLLSSIVRKDILEMLFEAGSGHPGGSLSAADILTVLYFGGILRYDPNDPDWQNRDRLVLSAGHKAPVLYAVLAEAGFFPREEFKNLRKTPDAMLQGHVDRKRTPGVDLSTGALGQGLSTALGMAAAMRFLKKTSHVWTVLGGGEEQEGQISEAARHAAVQQLTNQTVIIDDNDYQIEGHRNKVDAADIEKVWQGYGWNVVIVDGHDHVQLLRAMQKAKNDALDPSVKKPTCIIAKTIKGKAVSFFSKDEKSRTKSHGEVPKDETIRKEALDEINAAIGEYNPDELKRFMKSAAVTAEQKSKIDKENQKGSPSRVSQEVNLEPLTVGGKEATRTTFGKLLVYLRSLYSNIVAMSADLQPSVKMEEIEKLFGTMTPETPQGAYLAMGIREAHMASFMQGLALMGLVPFGGTFDIFTLNMLPQMRVAAQNKIPVVFVATHAGIGVGEDAKTHQGVEPPGIVNYLSGPDGDLIDIYEPGDAEDLRIILLNMFETGGPKKPVYLRLTRQDLAILDKSHLDQDAYKKQLLEGSYVLADPGEGENDLIIVATGGTVEHAVKASQELKTKGINAKVINVVSINRIDNAGNPFQGYLENNVPIVSVCDAYSDVLENPVLRAANHARKNGKNPGIVHGLGAKPEILGSGTPKSLYQLHGIDSVGILKSTETIVKRQKMKTTADNHRQYKNRPVYVAVVVEVKPGKALLVKGNDEKWVLPQVAARADEDIRQAAQRAVSEILPGEEIILGRPLGVISNPTYGYEAVAPYSYTIVASANVSKTQTKGLQTGPNVDIFDTANLPLSSEMNPDHRDAILRLLKGEDPAVLNEEEIVGEDIKPDEQRKAIAGDVVERLIQEGNVPPVLTTDLIVNLYGQNDDFLGTLLLIRGKGGKTRGKDEWAVRGWGLLAFPGGFIEAGKTTEQVALDEFREEVLKDFEREDPQYPEKPSINLENFRLEGRPFMIASDPSRDKMLYTWSIVYRARATLPAGVTKEQIEKLEGGDESTGYRLVTAVPPLEKVAFDHAGILESHLASGGTTTIRATGAQESEAAAEGAINRILIVGDPDYIESTRRLFSDGVYQFETAADMPDEGHSFDVVIVGEDGLETAEKIQAIKHTPVILVTDGANPDDNLAINSARERGLITEAAVRTRDSVRTAILLAEAQIQLDIVPDWASGKEGVEVIARDSGTETGARYVIDDTTGTWRQVSNEAVIATKKNIKNIEEQLASAKKETTRIAAQLERQKEIETELGQRLAEERSKQDKLNRIQELLWRHITKGIPFSAPEELKSQIAEYLFDAPDVASEARNFLDELDKKGESEFAAQAGQIAVGVFDRLYKTSKFSEARKINGFLGANAIYVDGEDDTAFAYAVFIARASQQTRLPFLLIAKDETTRQALAALIPGIAERNLKVMPSGAMIVTFIGDAIRDFQKEGIAKINFYLGRLVGPAITENFEATYPNVSFNTAPSPANAENLQTILSYNGITIPGISDTEFNLWRNAKATLRRCA